MLQVPDWSLDDLVLWYSTAETPTIKRLQSIMVEELATQVPILLEFRAEQHAEVLFRH